MTLYNKHKVHYDYAWLYMYVYMYMKYKTHPDGEKICVYHLLHCLPEDTDVIYNGAYIWKGKLHLNLQELFRE